MDKNMHIEIKKAGIFFPAWTVVNDSIRCKNKVYLFKDMSELQVAFNKVDFRSYDSLAFVHSGIHTILWAKTSLEEKLKLLEAFEYTAQFVKCYAYGEQKMARFYLAIAKALNESRNEYLDAFKDENQYAAVLEKLYKLLPELCNKYISAVLNAPLQSVVPRSPQSAAFLGTIIGGAAVGIAAGLEAVEKQKAYEQNRIDVIIAQTKKLSASDALISCIKQIESILMENSKTKEAWEKKKRETYINEFNSL